MSAAAMFGQPAARQKVSRLADPMWQRPRISLSPLPLAPLILFVLGLMLATEVRIVGTLFVGEVLLIPVALVVIASIFRKNDPELWKFTVAFGISLMAYINSDLINGSAMNDALRAWARVSFLIVILLAMRPILKKSRFNLLPLFFGMLLADILQHRANGIESLWKYYISNLVITVGLYLIASRGGRLVSVLSIGFLCIMAVFSVFIDDRSIAGFCLLAAAVVGARLVATRRLRSLVPVFLVGGLVVAAFGINYLLSRTNDEFGERRSGSNGMRLASLLTAAETVAAHPVFGVGSWSVLAEAADRHRQNAQNLGQKFDNESTTQGGHSTILQTWTEAGVFAAIPFIYYFWRLLAAGLWMLRKPLDRFYPAELFLLVNAIWACMFSPFGGAIRIYIGLTACLCVVLADEQRVFERQAAQRRRMLRQMEIERIRSGVASRFASA